MLSTIIYFPIARLILWASGLLYHFVFVAITFLGPRGDDDARKVFIDGSGNNSTDQLTTVFTTTGIAVAVYLLRGFLQSHAIIFFILLGLAILHNVFHVIVFAIQGYTCAGATGSTVRSVFSVVINTVYTLYCLGAEAFIALKMINIIVPGILG